MRIFVESLKRLYANYRITKESVIELFEKQKITEEEKIYILTGKGDANVYSSDKWWWHSYAVN